MLITFLLEVMCVMSGFIACSLAATFLNSRKSLKTAGNVARDNLRIFTRLLPKFDNNT